MEAVSLHNNSGSDVCLVPAIVGRTQILNRLLDSLKVTYPGSEKDRKEAECAHLRGDDHRFLLLLKQMRKKQLVYNGDRTHPRLKALDKILAHMIQTTWDTTIQEDDEDDNHNNNTRKGMYFEKYFYPGFANDYKKALQIHYEGDDDAFKEILQQMYIKQYAFRKSQTNITNNHNRSRSNQKNSKEKRLSKFSGKKWKQFKGKPDAQPYKEEVEEEVEVEERDPQPDNQLQLILPSPSSMSSLTSPTLNFIQDTQHISEARTAVPSSTVSNNNNNINSKETESVSPTNLFEMTQATRKKKDTLSSQLLSLFPFSAWSKRKQKKQQEEEERKKQQVQEEIGTMILESLQSHLCWEEQTEGLMPELPPIVTEITEKSFEKATKTFIRTTLDDAIDVIEEAIEVNGIDMMCDRVTLKHFVHDAMVHSPSQQFCPSEQTNNKTNQTVFQSNNETTKQRYPLSRSCPSAQRINKTNQTILQSNNEPTKQHCQLTHYCPSKQRINKTNQTVLKSTNETTKQRYPLSHYCPPEQRINNTNQVMLQSNNETTKQHNQLSHYCPSEQIINEMKLNF